MVTIPGVPLPDELTITIHKPRETSEPDVDLTGNSHETVPLRPLDDVDPNTDNQQVNT